MHMMIMPGHLLHSVLVPASDARLLDCSETMPLSPWAYALSTLRRFPASQYAGGFSVRALACNQRLNRRLTTTNN